MLADTSNVSSEQRVGAAMFRNIDYMYEMETMMRFTDDRLKNILRKMRINGGAKLTPDEKQSLRNTALDASQLKRESADLADWYESSYLWSIVSMAMYTRARQSARKQGQRLYICQAADHIYTTSAGKEYTDLYDRILRVHNLSTTSKLPPFALFHVGMRGRLTSQVLAPWAVQDCTGEVMEILFSDVDLAAQRSELHAGEGGDVTQFAAEYCLQSFPKGIYFKLDDCDQEFLPPKVCEAHRLVGFCATCDHCRNFPVWVLVEPLSRKWQHADDVLDTTFGVERTQLPIMPEKACSLYTLQGATTEPGMIAHLALPRRAGADMMWLIVYVMLSRVRSLDKLKTTGMNTDKEFSRILNIIEGGRPR